MKISNFEQVKKFLAVVAEDDKTTLAIHSVDKGKKSLVAVHPESGVKFSLTFGEQFKSAVAAQALVIDLTTGEAENLEAALESRQAPAAVQTRQGSANARANGKY